MRVRRAVRRIKRLPSQSRRFIPSTVLRGIPWCVDSDRQHGHQSACTALCGCTLFIVCVCSSSSSSSFFFFLLLLLLLLLLLPLAVAVVPLANPRAMSSNGLIGFCIFFLNRNTFAKKKPNVQRHHLRGCTSFRCRHRPNEERR